MRIRLCLAATLALAASTWSGLSQTSSLQFSSLAFTVKESTPLAKIIVTRLGGASGTVRVDFATVDSGGGNATAMEDYIPTNGTLTFGPGVKSRYFYVPILNDTAHEGNETVVLELRNPSEGATLGGQPNTTLTILDNDSCTYELSPGGRTHDQVGGLASFDVIAPTGCDWTAESTVAWIGISSGASGNGNGTVTYTYDPLGDVATRSGSIRVGDKTFAITQSFTVVAGTYAGLLYESTTPRHESSGSINVTVGAPGTFSAKLSVGSSRSSFSGRFGLDGKATNSLPLRDGTNVIVMLSLDLLGGTEAITGSADHGDWQAAVTAYRAAFDTRSNSAPQAGRYTVIIPGDVSHTDTQPGGDGYGTLQIGADGTAKLSATLADGTKLSAKAPLSKDGYWPLYVSLYGSQGSILGWMLFADLPDVSDLSGPLTWIKPASASAKYYPAGFAIQPMLTGSRYVAPTNEMDRVLNVTSGRLAFAGGNLAEAYENAITLSALGIVTNLSTNKLVVSIQKTSGLLTGAVTGPGAARSTAFRGAVHQKARFASGFFFGTNQTGRAHLSE
ncbi:MAG TPA: Calx-beta domain-containing protein [Verrucomicrobiae bacterium]|nr:Calx-beta domain-containing protein [Verrucomicrobiae bacterium]